MQSLGSVCLLAACANFDTIIVAMGYGAGRRRISPLASFLISAITTLGTALAMWAGDVLGDQLPASFADLLGGGLLLLMGLWTLADQLRTRAAAPAQPGPLGMGRAVGLSITLSVNNLGLGVAAGIAGFPLLTTAATTYIVTWAFLYGGYLLGEKLSAGRLGPLAGYASGALLILMGLWEAIAPFA